MTEVKFEDLVFVEQIGKGSFGTVSTGRWKALGSELVCLCSCTCLSHAPDMKIAIKRLHSSDLSEEAIKQFKQEVEVLQVCVDVLLC